MFPTLAPVNPVYFRKDAQWPACYPYLSGGPRKKNATDAGDVYDLAGGIVGTRVGGCTWANWSKGKCLSFDGSTGYVDFGNPTLFQVSAGAIFAKIRTSAAGASYRAVIAKNNVYSIFLLDNVFGAYDWGGGAFRSTGVNVADGIEHELGLTFGGGSGTFWLDGKAVTTTAYSVGSPQTVSLQVGANGGGQNFAGSIGAFRFFTAAPSAQTIAADAADPSRRLRSVPIAPAYAATRPPAVVSSPASFFIGGF